MQMLGLFGLGAFILILAGTTAWILQTGIGIKPGRQFYDACWAKAHANGKEPESPEQAAQWGSCQETADAALFDAGFIFAGNPENAVTPQLKAVVMACPSSWSEIPIDGVWSLAVSRIAQQGGPTPLDRFMPARNVVVRVFQRRWPSCATVARANGFPLITKHSGSWDWAKTCEPCKAEQMAIANSLAAAQARASGMDRHDASPEVRKG